MDKLELLKEVFKFDKFREGQEPVIDAVMGDSYGVLAVMPTGRGKSLLYQLPALLMPGLTIVISPLISLMQDQTHNLQKLGVKASFYNSSLSEEQKREVVANLMSNNLKILFVAPERFNDENFVNILNGLDVSIIAIDESHCISAWGHDFRPAYRKIGKFINTIKPTQVIALTATATPIVQRDICNQLRFEKPKVFISGFFRDNLNVSVMKTKDVFNEILVSIEEQLEMKNPTGIVYCGTRKEVEAIGVLLNANDIPALTYHAGMKNDKRKEVQDKWKEEGGVIVATNAFGMGIDRPDVRFVYHGNMPGTVEAYYQEIGRAGRDGKPSECVLFTNFGADIRLQKWFIDIANPPEAQVDKLHKWLISYGKKHGGKVELTQEKMGLLSGADKNYIGGSISFLKKFGVVETEGKGDYRVFDNHREIDWKLLHQNRKESLADLDSMISFAESDQCRMKNFNEFFGDFTMKKTCGKCDNCLYGVKKKR